MDSEPLDKIRNGDTLDIVCRTLSNRGFRPPNHASEEAGLIERPKTIHKKTAWPPSQKGNNMKTMLALATAMVFIAALFSSSASAGDKNKKKLDKEGPVQQQESQKANPPGVVDIGPAIKLEEAVGKLKNGETTMEEALALLGQPQVPSAMGGPNGGLTLMYHWRKQFEIGFTGITPGQAAADAALGPIALLTGRYKKRAERNIEMAQAVQNSFKSLTLIFDGEGKLKQWVSHPLIMPKQAPSKNAPLQKDTKAEATPPAESPPLAAVTQPPR